MFRPLDTLSFDTDWPVDNGRIAGLRDIRIIVTGKPDGWTLPCGMAVTAVTATSLTVAMCTRGTHEVNASTTLTIQKDASGSLGKVYRGSNQYMTIDMTAGDGDFSVSAGTLPLLVVPCCVMWLPPSYDPFDGSALPNPADGSGWSRTVDPLTRRIIYKGAAPSSTGGTRSSTYLSNRLKCLNGQSPVDLSIVADGDGRIDTEEGVITIRPGLRDIDDTGRKL